MENSELVPVINIGLNTGRYNFDYAMEELKALSQANNMTVIETIVQNLSQPIAGTYFGTGKVEELRDVVVDTGAEIVVANDELTPSQIRNLENVVKVPVMDRTGLILAILPTVLKVARQNYKLN